MFLDNQNILRLIIEDCKKGKRRSQDELYKGVYAYGMSVCLRYSKTKEEAHEILNDGMVKVMTKLDKYDYDLSFKAWVRRILINTAIDSYRKNEKHYNTLDIAHARTEYTDSTSLENLSAQEIIGAVQQLPPAYKMVFNLYAIEGYKHHEIAKMLGVTEGTTKSNLAKARMKLQKMLRVMNQEDLGNHG